MPLEDAVESFDQACIGGDQGVARAPPAALGDDRFAFELGQIGHLQLFEFADFSLYRLHPTAVELVPVRVVVAGPSLERLSALGDHRLVLDRGRAQVDIAVDYPILGSKRRRHGEQASARLAQTDDEGINQQGIEWTDGLGPVHRVAEPEASLIEGAAIVADQRVVGIHLLPALAALRRGPEWARKAL